MATYIVGDIQGCAVELEKLLRKCNFDCRHDQLWLVGDLVGRGPHSLETLRLLRSLGDAVVAVLGNHDLHLLAISEGIRDAKPKDKLDALLAAPDFGNHIDWLRQQPLLIKHPQHQFVMVHAGLPPQWGLPIAEQMAQAVSEVIRSPNRALPLLQQMYNNEPALWSASLTDIEQLRFTINALTRMRYCYADGALDMTCKSPLGEQRKGLIPWFKLRQTYLDPPLLFGHWAALMGKTKSEQYIGLDTGCVWGNHLSMLRWEDRKLYKQRAITRK